MSMLKVGDKVQDLDLADEPTGPVWLVTAVEPRSDGKFSVTIERREACGDVISTTMTVRA